MTEKNRIDGGGGGLDDTDIQEQAAALGVAQAVSRNGTPPGDDNSRFA